MNYSSTACLICDFEIERNCLQMTVISFHFLFTQNARWFIYVYNYLLSLHVGIHASISTLKVHI